MSYSGASLSGATTNKLKALAGIGLKKTIDAGVCLKEMSAVGLGAATEVAIAAIGSQTAARIQADLKNMGDKGLKTAIEAGNGLSNVAAAGMKAADDCGGALKSFADSCDQALDGKTVGGYELKPLVGVGLKVTAGAAITLGVVTVAMPVVGFTSAGVGANTLAAAWQSSIGNVAAGSLFSSLQSAGVVGLAATTKTGIAVAGGIGGGYLGLGFKTNDKKE